jgi:hypothetical protein
MPTAEEQVFTLGTDLTPTLGAGVALIEQAIELATTTSYRGLVIYSDTTPATSGQPSGYPTGWYEWHKRCLWLKPSTGEVFRWNGTTWALSLAKPGANSVGTSELIDDSVTIAKLNPTGGQQYQIIRVNDAEDSFEYIDAADLFGPNELDITKLGGSSTGSFVLTRNGTSKAWTLFNSATIVGLFGANSFPIDYLVRGSALQVPMTNAAGTAVTWASVLTGIANYTIPLTKISKTIADAGKWLRVQADGSVLPETLSTSSSSGTTFASESEVTTGTETTKAISPATAGSIPGLWTASGFIDLTINNGGTDDVTAVALVAGSKGIASIADDGYSYSGPTTWNGSFIITFTKPLLSVSRMTVEPVDIAVIHPAGVNGITPTQVIARLSDTQLRIRLTLSVAASGVYRMPFILY